MHQTHTVEWAGLKGRKNGELLRAAVSDGYDALLTVDQGIRYQQHTPALAIGIVVIRSRTNQLEDLLPLVESILKTLETIRPGDVVTVP